VTTVLVTGATGRLGRVLVERLAAAGHHVRALSRRPAPPRPGVEPVASDLRSGAGVDAALTGAGVVVHCATSNGRRDEELTATLVAAARRCGRPHVVDVSIVGADRIRLPYYRTKVACEELVAGSGLPWTVLRTTQFHSLVAQLFDLQWRSPVFVVPATVPVQPIDTRDVAARLVELVAGPPAGRVPGLGGPEVWSLRELGELYAQVRGLRRRVLAVPVPGAVARAYREGHHLTGSPGAGRITFADYLVS
jgi:uncharacterized protein YbjT (DUF2867 family)